MGELDWQLWVTLAVVMAAAGAVLRRSLSFLSGRGQSACEDCSAKPVRKDEADRVISESEIDLMYRKNES